MTSTKELRISCDELSHVHWQCPNCSAEQSIDLGNEIHVGHIRKKEGLNGLNGLKCPVCNVGYEPSLRSAITHLHSFMEDVKLAKQLVFFRVTQPA